MKVEASTKHLSDVRNFVARHASDQGFSENQVSDLKLAVDEAYTNIIKHAYNSSDQNSVEIFLKFDSEKLCVSLLDQGKSFEPDTYAKPNISEKIQQGKRGGMGVYLIHQLMDSVSYHADSGKNEIRLCKKRA